MATTKAFIYTILIMVCIALSVALVYFLTVFGGAIIIGIIVFLIIREYNLEVSEQNKGNDP